MEGGINKFIWAITVFMLGYYVQLSRFQRHQSSLDASQPEVYHYSALDDVRTRQLEGLLASAGSSNSLMEQMNWLRTVSHRDLPSVMQRLKEEGDTLFRNALEIHWADTDPEGAVEYVRHHLSDNVEFAALVLSRWAKKDPQAAIGGARKIGHTGLLEDFDRSSLCRHSREMILSDLRSAHSKPSFITGIFETLAQEDVSSAIEEVEALSSHAAKRQAIRGIGKALGRDDPIAGIEWAESFASSELRGDATRVVLSEWIAQDPAEAARVVAGLPKSVEAIPLYESLAKAWSEQEPGETVAWVLENTSGRTQTDVLTAAFADAKAPGEVVQLLLDHELTHTQGPLFEHLMAEWAAATPEDALGWSHELPEEVRGSALAGIMSAMAKTDPEAATEFLGQLPEGDSSLASVIRGISAGMGSAEPLSGLSMIDRHEGALSLEDFTRISAPLVDSLGNTAPDLAAEWMQHSGFLEEVRYTHVSRQTVKNLTTTWAGADLEAAENWVDGLSGTSREDALESMARFQLSIDPAEAFRWAAKLSEFQKRTNVMSNLFSDLPNTLDVPELLEESPLSASDKKHLQRDLRMHGHL